jgi:hypothetical protein
MRVRLLAATAVLAVTVLPVLAHAEHKLPPVQPAATYPDADVHAAEHVAIAAVPFATEEEQKVFTVNYSRLRFLPIRVIVTNEGDRPISMADIRAYFISANGDRIPAADPDDVERRVVLKDKTGTRIPIGPIQLHTHGRAPDSKVEKDFDNYEYSALTVNPHQTCAGFLWYDIDGLGPNPLQGAKLVVREVKNADGQQLFYFEIPLDKK